MDERDKRLLLETYGRRTLDLMDIVLDDEPGGEFLGYDECGDPIYRYNDQVYRLVLRFIWVCNVDENGNQFDDYVPVRVKRKVVQKEE